MSNLENRESFIQKRIVEGFIRLQFDKILWITGLVYRVRNWIFDSHVIGVKKRKGTALFNWEHKSMIFNSEKNVILFTLSKV